MLPEKKRRVSAVITHFTPRDRWFRSRSDVNVENMNSALGQTAQWNTCVDTNVQRPRPKFPMLVIPVRKVLEMTEIKRHEEVKDLLVEWKPGMADVLFVSHTWLRWQAPDCDNVKLDLLQSILRKVVEGKTQNIKTHFFGGQDTCTDSPSLSASLRDGYVWMDVMSIPQTDPDLQKDAIQSIVADATFFCMLAGACRHEDGSVRDSRGNKFTLDLWWSRSSSVRMSLGPRTK